MNDETGFARRIRLSLQSTMDDEGIDDALFKVASSRLNDPDLARNVIGYAAVELISGRPLGDDLREWLGWALMGIARGIDPKTALCLNKRGAPAKVSWEQVFPLVHDRIVGGEAWTTVCKDAAVQLSEILRDDIDEKTIRLVYKETLKDWYDSWVVEDPAWEGDHPTSEELRSFRRFTFECIKHSESLRQIVLRGRK